MLLLVIVITGLAALRFDKPWTPLVIALCGTAAYALTIHGWPADAREQAVTMQLVAMTGSAYLAWFATRALRRYSGR